MGRRGKTVAALLTVGLSLSAVPAGAMPSTERAPNPLACVHNNTTLDRPSDDQVKGPYWPQEMLQFSKAWAFTRGAQQVVAVVDSGVDAGHPQLLTHVQLGFSVTGDPKDLGITDCAGHGTEVAGIIAAQPTPGIGMSGIAPDAMILPIRETWGIDNQGHSLHPPVQALIDAINKAIFFKIKTINVSVTVPETELSPWQLAEFDNLAKQAAANDCLIVAASGNRPQDGTPVAATYPAKLAATSPNVIAVSGVTANGTPDPDAITGPYVTVAAPDRQFLTTIEGPAIKGRGLIAVGGTSFAAPFVSGLAALVRARFPNATAPEIKARIAATADHPSTRLPDPQLGYGVINPLAAVTAVLPPMVAPAPLPTHAGPIGILEDKDAAARAWAYGTAAFALVLAGVFALGARAVRRGRQRDWRPGNRPTTA
jgi:membrane-anchored mycosin MYCP